MKRQFLWMLTCILTLCGAAMFTSCSDNDGDGTQNSPLAEQIQGQWILISDFTADDDDDDDAYFEDDDFDDIEGITPSIFDFHREVIHVNLDELGNGSLLFFAVDSNNDPVGGEGDGLQMALAFAYTVQADGSILVTSKAPIEGMEENDEFSFRYENGHLIADSGEQQFALHRLSQAEETQMTTWKIALGLGGAMLSSYNPNDEDFTPTTWRDQDAIYLYDGKGPETDSKGKKGYTLVPMPWSNLPVQTNLPHGFCDNLTPENGWEWAYNLCGNNSLTNANFFAVYNKFTGILRFFYYMPDNFSTGNDHVWQVSMTDNMALKSLWGYGLPSKENFKDKSKVAPTGAGTMVDYVAPWVEMRTSDGLIMPNAGWWAFDVDLSLYRSGIDISKDAIKLQMRSWNIQHVSLFSTMTATIEGTIKQTVQEVESSSSSTSKGVMTGLEMASFMASSVAYFLQGDIGDGLSAVAYMFGSGSELAGILEGDDEKEEPFEGEISLGMNGTINTEGFIKDAVPTVGVASPTIQMKDFDTKNTHLGQGSWNIKKFPKVYVVKDVKFEISSMAENSAIPSYFVGFPYFFDPKSVEVELNPEVFPESDIEWMQVDATCGVTKATGMTGTDSHRAGFGLQPRTLGLSLARIAMKTGKGNNLEEIMNLSGISNVFDYLYYEDNKGKTSYPVKVCEIGQHSNYTREIVFGRGVKDSHAIEPVLFEELSPFSYDAYYPIKVPALEVNVTVLVKLRSMSRPIALSRNYLPELQAITRDQMRTIANDRYNELQNSPTNQHRESYNLQLSRIKKLYDVFSTYPIAK